MTHEIFKIWMNGNFDKNKQCNVDLTLMVPKPYEMLEVFFVWFERQTIFGSERDIRHFQTKE